MAARPATIGQLRADGWESRPVKEEIRANAVARIAAGEPLFERVLGYEQTVLPQLENALLAGHDIIFLGERGQAKTRMIRSLTGLLDEWMPIIAGSEINDDPYAPVSRHARDLVAEHGEDTPITWVHRDDRFGEKLATPDTSIADLIGEVDPIKVAEGRYLSDELTLHYGLVPRTNRGIFAINELPDLAERIQVGLLNVLEERDIQVRGYKIRLPLDVLLVASANPEDYTNRGRIITPLKDRFGSQIRTHYPLEVATELAIVAPGGPLAVGRRRRRADARLPRRGDHDDQPPGPGQHPRQPAQRRQRAPVGDELRGRVGQRAAPRAAGRRARRRAAGRRPRGAGGQLRRQDRDRVARRGSRGRDLRQPRQGRRADRVQGARARPSRPATSSPRSRRASSPTPARTSRRATWPRSSSRCPALRPPVAALTAGDESPAAVAAAVSFVLEGLHLSKRLNKDTSGTSATYRSRS